jgi:hypothetical protein
MDYDNLQRAGRRHGAGNGRQWRDVLVTTPSPPCTAQTGWRDYLWPDQLTTTAQQRLARPDDSRGQLKCGMEGAAAADDGLGLNLGRPSERQSDLTFA